MEQFELFESFNMPFLLFAMGIDFETKNSLVLSSGGMKTLYVRLSLGELMICILINTMHFDLFNLTHLKIVLI